MRLQGRNPQRAMPKRWRSQKKPMPQWALFFAIYASTVELGLAYTGGWLDKIPDQLAGNQPVQLMNAPLGVSIPKI